MDKAKLLQWIQSLAPELRLSARRCVDQAERSLRNREALSGVFLTPEEQKAAVSVAGFFDCPEFVLWPSDAERKLFLTAGVGADPMDAADAEVLQIERILDQSHRDVLGTLLATGIARESIGDIRIDRDRAECMVKSSVAGYLADQVQRIGKSNVRIKKTGMREFTLLESRPEPTVVIVASLRLDAVVAAVASCSREQASQRIRRGEVKHNHVVTRQPGQALEPNDVLSIRGIGRIRIVSEEKKTKKGNIVLLLEQSR